MCVVLFYWGADVCFLVCRFAEINLFDVSTLGGCQWTPITLILSMKTVFFLHNISHKQETKHQVKPEIPSHLQNQNEISLKQKKRRRTRKN